MAHFRCYWPQPPQWRWKGSRTGYTLPTVRKLIFRSVTDTCPKRVRPKGEKRIEELSRCAYCAACLSVLSIIAYRGKEKDRRIPSGIISTDGQTDEPHWLLDLFLQTIKESLWLVSLYQWMTLISQIIAMMYRHRPHFSQCSLRFRNLRGDYWNNLATHYMSRAYVC